MAQQKSKQSTLDSFFGRPGGAKPKSKKTQTTITSMFKPAAGDKGKKTSGVADRAPTGAKKSETVVATKSKLSPEAKPKENSSEKKEKTKAIEKSKSTEDGDVFMDTPESSPTKEVLNSKGIGNKRGAEKTADAGGGGAKRARRRAIVDDSEDDDDDDDDFSPDPKDDVSESSSLNMANADNKHDEESEDDLKMEDIEVTKAAMKRKTIDLNPTTLTKRPERRKKATPVSGSVEKKKKTTKGGAGEKKQAASSEKREDSSKKAKSKVEEAFNHEDSENDDGATDIDPSVIELRKQAARLAKVAKAPSDLALLEDAPEKGKPVPYKTLVLAFEKIDAITGRLDIQKIMTALFRRVLLVQPKDLYPVVYLASNSVAPAYECVELGIGDSILIKAIGEAYGTNPSVVKKTYEKEGDLGSVAQMCKSKQRTLSFGIKPKPLSVANVLDVFRVIAKISGTKSQKQKVDEIKKLLVRVQYPAETKFIIRGLQGKLRIGLAQSTVLVSLAHAFALTVPRTMDGTANHEGKDTDHAKILWDASATPEKRLEAAANIVKQVYSEVPSYDSLLDAALKVPLPVLTKACSFQPGIPVAPMLAKPTKSIQEVLKRLNGTSFTCEFKYDGERAQIHKSSDGKLKVFSRNLLETSGKYPEVPMFVEEAAKDGVDSFVLDAEVVAYNPKTKQLVPFQVLSTRKKTEESAATAKVQVIVQAFDLMYLNGQSLLDSSLEYRRKLLKENFEIVEGKFQYAVSLDFVEDGDTTPLEAFLDSAVKGQCEGLMVKTMADVYEPSRRSLNWLKLKKDYLDGLGDTFDLVPLGAYYGKGKRTGVYGAYLLACYDADTEEFQSVCKIGTGFSDEDLKTLSEELNKHKIESKSSQYVVADGLACDVWFDAVQVWEVKAADLSKSSLHRGAMGKTGEAGRGIGLRFPRFERIREDKKPDDATNSDQIIDMYFQQDTVNGQGNDDDVDDGI